MGYVELFEDVADHVRGLGVGVVFERRRRPSARAIERWRQAAVVPIPDSLLDFYREVGDGFSFRWQAVDPDEDETGPMAVVEFGPLCQLAATNRPESWTPEWDETYEFAGTRDRKLAKRTAIRMRRWIHFYEEGNGDTFAIDTGIDPPPVVFHQHDWFDGGTGENGHAMGATLWDFFLAWSKVCFQSPAGLWWPEVFLDGSGIDWSSDEFDDRFRLPQGRR